MIKAEYYSNGNANACKINVWLIFFLNLLLIYSFTVEKPFLKTQGLILSDVSLGPIKYYFSNLYIICSFAFSALPKYSDTIVTAVLILACIVSAVFLVVFVSLQIYAESLYLVQVIMVERVFVEEMLRCTFKCYYHADFVRYNWVLVVIITEKICP